MADLFETINKVNTANEISRHAAWDQGFAPLFQAVGQHLEKSIAEQKQTQDYAGAYKSVGYDVQADPQLSPEANQIAMAIKVNRQQGAKDKLAKDAEAESKRQTDMAEWTTKEDYKFNQEVQLIKERAKYRADDKNDQYTIGQYNALVNSITEAEGKVGASSAKLKSLMNMGFSVNTNGVSILKQGGNEYRYKNGQLFLNGNAVNSRKNEKNLKIIKEMKANTEQWTSALSEKRKAFKELNTYKTQLPGTAGTQPTGTAQMTADEEWLLDYKNRAK